MPVAIACPKCQTRYTLPDQALGKPVKCKSCGVVFKTKAPGASSPTGQGQPQRPARAAQQPPAQRKAAAPNPDLAKFGIDGPISRAADVFGGNAAPPPQMGNPLGNFVLDDPGFADLRVAEEEAQQEMSGGDGMADILNNPYMTSEKGSTRGRKTANAVDVSGYAVARVGMWMVYISWGLTLGITVFFALFGAIVRLVPQDTLRSIAETLGPTFGQALLWLVAVFFWVGMISVAVVFIGQILCIFAPNNDERLFAGLTVGSIVGAFVLLFVTLLMGVFAGIAGEEQVATQAVFGVFVLLAIFGVYALLLASMFFFMTYFRRIGKNIKAKEVVEAAKMAMLTWVAAIAIGIITFIASFILSAIFGPDSGKDPETFRQIMDILGLINLALVIAVMGTLLMMVRAAIDRTQPG